MMMCGVHIGGNLWLVLFDDLPILNVVWAIFLALFCLLTKAGKSDSDLIVSAVVVAVSPFVVLLSLASNSI